MLGNFSPLDALLAFASERESMRRRKEAGEPWPWSFDPTLSHYSFTNVRREDDRTTRHYARLVRDRYKDNVALLAATVAYRWFNRIETGESLFNIPGTFGLSAFDWALERDPTETIWRAVQIKPPPHTTGAFYVPSPKDRPGLSKGEGISILVGRFFRYSGWRAKWEHWSKPGFTPTLNKVHEWLTTAQNIGTFGAGQIIADLRYVEPLCRAPDINTWAAPGPGSMRGLNLVLGRDEKAPWTPAKWRDELRRLDDDVKSRLEAGVVPPLHLQDFQNVLCETAKLICHDRWGAGIKQSHKPRRDQLVSEADVEDRAATLYFDASHRFDAIGIDVRNMPDIEKVVKAMVALWREFRPRRNARRAGRLIRQPFAKLFSESPAL